MVKKMEVLAIIPARGGSKGVPRKNIRLLGGYPLIAYSIAAGLQSEVVTRVIVTTDDQEIADVAAQYGAEVPFIRPDYLAQDNTLDLPVFQHALHWLADHENYWPDIVIQLRPTSPFRPITMIDDAVEMYLSSDDTDSVRGVVPAGQNPHKMWRVDEKNQRMTSLLKVEGIAEPFNAPRQALPQIYWQTGHIDVIKPEVILEQESMSGKVIRPLIIDSDYIIDIDRPVDFLRAEWVLRNSNLQIVYPGAKKRPLPENIELVVFDFDGVLTDNRVWVSEIGEELVAANRSDSMGIGLLRKAGIGAMVLSTEVNPVVTARCKKMRVPVLQGIEDKATVLRKYLSDHQINPENVIFVGNDINDVPCFPIVGCAVAVADAQTGALAEADIVLMRRGGHGAVRELIDTILAVKTKQLV